MPSTSILRTVMLCGRRIGSGCHLFACLGGYQVTRRCAEPSGNHPVCASTSAAMIRWAAARDRERGQSARNDRDRQTASDTLTASGDVVGYVRCSDRDGTDNEGRAEADRSSKPPGPGAAGANQRSSASTNPSTSPTSPAQAMHPSGRISIDGPASAGKQRTCVKPTAKPAAHPSGDVSSSMPSPSAISANSDVRTSAQPTERSPMRRPTTSRSEPRS
jgi:hypothetical protein